MGMGGAFVTHRFDEFDVRRDGRVRAFEKVKAEGGHRREHGADDAEHEKDGTIGGARGGGVRITHAHRAGEGLRRDASERGGEWNETAQVHTMILRALLMK